MSKGRVARNLRIAGNVGLIVGQVFLLFISKPVGLSIMVVSGLMGLPYFVSRNYKDVTAIIILGLVINIAALFSG